MAMRKIVLIGLLCAVGCSRLHSGSSGPVMNPQYLQSTSATSKLQGFVVDISLSEKAMNKLLASKETVVAAAYLYGKPKQGALKNYVSEMGEIGGLGDIEMEVAPGKSAVFGEIRMSQDVFEQTDKQSPQLLINVFSGRKSSENNLLNCDIYEGKLSEVQGRHIPIACKLIRE